jgi:hypothetical protein
MLTFGHWRSALVALIGVIGLLHLQPAQAHLMVAQRGTLNFVGSGGFVVMALPVDAFTGVDDDGDGLMSMAEMKAHGGDIEAQIQRGLQLKDAAGPRPLQALMLNLSPDDRTPTAPAAHLVALGRFALAEEDGLVKPASGLTLHFSLFGKTDAAQQQMIVVTQGNLKQQLVLAPERKERTLFPPAWLVLRDNAVLGAEHVLSGLDHLLFLLVVLATGWGWRQIVLALTCFTAGHATTLAASVLGGWTVPSAVVEPAIAATIIGMAMFDRWSRSRPQPWPDAVRLSLIFGCALVHGLGLAGGLTDLGLDSEHRLLSLAGFNLGIEAGQLAVALLAIAVMSGIKRLKGNVGLNLTTGLASYFAMAAGFVWLVQRVAVSV